jgi:hypothetical protein
MNTASGAQPYSAGDEEMSAAQMGQGAQVRQASGVAPAPVAQSVDAARDGSPRQESVPAERGVTFRVVILCLALALFFAYAIPVIDYKFFNTFLGATHLPPGALAVLLMLLLVVNPLLGLLSRHFRFSRNEILTIYISCLISCLVPGIGGNNYFVSFIIGSFTSRRAKISGSSF